MSLSATCESVSRKRTLSSLLAGRVIKRPKQEDRQRLQEAAIQLLEQNQNICSLFRELGKPNQCNILSSQNEEAKRDESGSISSVVAGSLLGSELRCQAKLLGVPVTVLSVKSVLERLMEITEEKKEEEDEDREMLTISQRVQVGFLLESSRELLSQGILCPKLLWQEFRRDQLPKLEVVYYLHRYNILTLKYMVESDEGVRSWLVPRLKALCGWTPPLGEEETKQVQRRVLTTVVGVLVATAFEQNRAVAAADRKISVLCCSVLDDVLFWLLDTVDECGAKQSCGAGAQRWIQTFDASLCGVSVSPEALQRFFTHSLTQTLTHNPQLTVSDAVALQSEWTFAKASHSLTSLFRKLAVIFSVEQLLSHLQQVLETHEVNWKHVLCFLSTLLVYYQSSQSSVKELLSRLLNSAFEGYDLESMITAFLLARQGALEGSAIFPSYSDWFKMSFGGSSSYQSNSKKSLVFLLKFLSDLVPFEPPQYLKIHILHPPYVPAKHRSLLMEYVSLAKTRLADLKESVEEMGLYEDVSGGSAELTTTLPQSQSAQDVEKAVSLFESTGRISATVMEASIFRRPYFLTRFLPALLKARVLPVKPDARMSFIEALKKADKIPSAQYSSYVESCQSQRQQNKRAERPSTNDDPLDILKIQLQEVTEVVVGGNDGEISAQLSRISHTLSVIFPGCPDEPTGRTLVTLDTNALVLNELHEKVVNGILQNFCQCLLIASRSNPPDKQSFWASRFIGVLLGNTQLLSKLLHRLWDLFHNQGSSLSAAHVLGLAVFMVHLHAATSHSPLVQLEPPVYPQPVSPAEALSSAVLCNTRSNMLFSARLCVAAVCYGIHKGGSLPLQQQQQYVPSSLFKKLLYLVPRLLPESRRTSADPEEEGPCRLWSSVTDENHTWRKTALHLWRHAALQQLKQIPQYQLCFSEWLDKELSVRRSEDILSDSERQEHQQWVCLELYLTLPEEQGGCGGDMRRLCSHLLNAVLDQHLSLNLEQTGADTCSPDILSRLQEFVYEMEVTSLPGGRGHSSDLCDFLFETLSQRCSHSRTSASVGISTELSLHTWNRVLLALPAVLLFKVKAEGGKTTLDCSKLIEHVNEHQRNVCFPASVLPCCVTGHFLKGLLCASVRCGRPAEEVNRCWSQMSGCCPLLVVSAAHWWQQLSSPLFSLWGRLRDGEPPPEQLQLLTDGQRWACSVCSVEKGQEMPSAAALQLAAGLHRARQAGEVTGRSIGAALTSLQPEKSAKLQQVLVFLLFLCVRDYLCALTYAQEENLKKAKDVCTELLTALQNSSDWLLVFKTNEQSPYRAVTLMQSDERARLMPWAFCSLLLNQSVRLLQKLVCCPGFLHTAIACYVCALQLFLGGDAPEEQLESPEMLSHTKKFLLGVISQASPTVLSSNQLRQLESLCADLDPELAAALSVTLDPHSLSPEMDFL
ncbi:Fanconi anemia group A protein isoform X2 [Nothobranchius furzeri]|uniref:Fanconi anemia group A protein isoform X2 n=1 Tax=Nothobranchius furzeri TaxID=105023 RepID=UPI002403BE30|nr:Fanconi anemia group A protein isoform X2 [Nothobranchius furzeri]